MVTTSEFDELIEVLRDFIRSEVMPAEAGIDESDEIPDRLITQAKEMGLYGYALPSEFGGLGLSVEQQVLVTMELGYTSPAFRSLFGTNNGIAGQVLVLAGTEEQRKQWLPRLASGEVVASFALTEPDAGSDPSRLVTSAVPVSGPVSGPDGDGWVIDGLKRYITNAPAADVFMVFARTDPEAPPGRGIGVFIVPARLDGVSVAARDHKMGQARRVDRRRRLLRCPGPPRRAGRRGGRGRLLHRDAEPGARTADHRGHELHNRRKGDAVRLEIEAGARSEIVERLRVNFELDEDQVFRGDGLVYLSRLPFFYEDVRRPDLKFPAFTPRAFTLSRKSTNIFDELRQHDILLHHPYDSYDPVVDFIQQGAEDPAVVTMKQTLYRTSHDSPVFQALIEAAATKEATLVVELMARFDEASNIRWARSMEDAGVQVFHGVVGLKTHCKLAMLVRRDEDGVTRRYCHLGTGNYNPVTARFYTDLSLLTCDPQITERVHMVFNYLTAHAEIDDYRPLLVAPAHHGRELSPPHSPRAGTRPGRPPRAHRRQDERAARALA